MKGKGSYALILRCDHDRDIDVGKLGRMRLQAGWYIYCGSAFGPGGVAARLRHHYRVAKKPRWHLDYLRARCEPTGHWVNYDPVNREHDWAAMLLSLPGFSMPMPGFGSSDCHCRTHLAWSAERPDFEQFVLAVYNRQPGHTGILCADSSFAS